jgi:putative ABC transport system permease protein
MFRVALRGLAGRKLRAALTAVAIVLGVAMVSGTYILTDTIEKGFDTIFDRSYEGSDVVISGKVAFSVAEEEEDAPSFPASVLEEVRRLEGVAAAAGAIEDEANLVKDGETIESPGGAPSLALGIDPREERFNPLSLTAGDWPSAADEIAIDAATADDEELGVGDTVGVAARGPARSFRVTGIAEFGGVSSLGGATLAVFDVPTAQELFDKRGELDIVRVAGEQGVGEAELVSRIRPILPPTARVQSASAQADEDAEDTSSGISFLRYILLAFGGIALFVGSFVIANTLTITIAQRVREFATLRTIGASRPQLLVSVILESLVIGALASVVGLFLGLALAELLNSLFVAFGIDLPSSGTVFATRTIVISLLVGIVVTLLASLRPALRATRVPPIAAVREGSILPPSRFARFGLPTALVVLGLGVALLAYGVFADGVGTANRLIAVAVGSLLLFIGVTLLAPRLVRPLASILGWPAARVGGAAGELARENAMRNPGRTASTAGALMIGLALVTFVAVLGQGIRSSFEDAVDELFVADYAIGAGEVFDPLTPQAGEAARRAPGVEVVSGVRDGDGRVFRETVLVSGVDEDMGEVIDVDWTQGSDAVPAGLGRDGTFVKEEYADEHDLSLASPLSVQTPTGRMLELEVRGIFDEPTGGSPFGEVTISTELFDASYPTPQNIMTLVNMRGGVSEENTEALERAIRRFPDAQVRTASQFKEDAIGPLKDVLNILYALLGLSVLVSFFGIVNTLVLTVFERTRELGMLRAVGMNRRQVRRMIRHESIVTALIGAALGIAVGLFLAFLVTRVLEDEGIRFALPVASLALFVLAAIVVGILAAVVPARRAARLNVLRALQYE